MKTGVGMPKLGVNIDHIATIRQARREKEPDIVRAASVCESAGADSITVHLREDRRHIQDEDVRSLKKSIKTKLNLEMSIAKEIVDIAADVKPDYVCLVPEKREELTTEGGLDILSQKDAIASVVEKLKKKGIKVSIFIDPEENQIKAASDIKADCIELHTGAYAGVFKLNPSDKNRIKQEFLRLEKAGNLACSLGLILNAGHGLDYKNVVPVAKIKGMNELNIGFSIIAHAAFVGLKAAVKEMRKLVTV
ncbi:MAG: pyridoxine 5'-phosphate synthase [Endomicrobiales bacterium]|nr:pyridoxine 5'-phosphate synthase [Endomicrobiales bacterium]